MKGSFLKLVKVVSINLLKQFIKKFFLCEKRFFEKLKKIALKMVKIVFALELGKYKS